jgi:2-C-methyl-D-erythritol 2,4-cyclodiphosphate synthase
MRIGHGYDLHRLVPGRPLILAGVHVPHERGLEGHSDADVLAHAITDAVLGAAALGNIGQHFPDTDPAFKDADSLELLRRAYQMAVDAGFRLTNVDATIIAQRPKLMPYLDAMRDAIADCFGAPRADVSVKAKTNEHVGPEGRGEAISVHAVVLLQLLR